MSDKTAIVTGAGTGVGKGVALALVEAGWNTVFCGRRKAVLDEAVAEAKGGAAKALAVACDISKPDEVNALFAKTVETFGRVDLRAELDLFLVEVDAGDEPGDGLGAHAALEVLAEAHDELAPQHLVFDDLAGEQALELVERAGEHVELLLVALPDRREVALGRALAGLDLGVLRALRLELGQLGLELFLAPGQLELAR